MKKVVFLIALINAFGVFAAAQKSNAPTAKFKPPSAAAPIAAEISETEWKVLTDALLVEDWTKSASIAAEYSPKLKSDNDKKQLAQLRYLRLYALAGKILAVSGASVPANTDALWKDLDEAASASVGKEFLLPPRRYLNECRKVANYICRVADNDRALRVTATNKEGTGIHSFDYVIFDEANRLSNLPESELFLGGTLKRIEYNQDSSKPWVMRLVFEKGYFNAIRQ